MPLLAQDLKCGPLAILAPTGEELRDSLGLAVVSSIDRILQGPWQIAGGLSAAGSGWKSPDPFKEQRRSAKQLLLFCKLGGFPVFAIGDQNVDLGRALGFAHAGAVRIDRHL